MGRAQGHRQAASAGFSAVFGTRRTGGNELRSGDELLYHIVDEDSEEWRLAPDGPLHREHGPAWRLSGRELEEESWYRNGFLHREDGPARVVKTRDGVPVEEQWFKDGQCHRDGDEPALMKYEKGKLSATYYHHYGELHRDGDKPAVIYRDKSGTVQEYHRHGKLHRELGPARITYHVDGSVRERTCWLDGVQQPN